MQMNIEQLANSVADSPLAPLTDLLDGNRVVYVNAYMLLFMVMATSSAASTWRII